MRTWSEDQAAAGKDTAGGALLSQFWAAGASKCVTLKPHPQEPELESAQLIQGPRR